MCNINCSYNDTISVREGLVANLPDFKMECLGEVEKPLSVPGRKSFKYWVLIVSSGQEKKRLEYSGGTGLWGPLKFTINNKNFVTKTIAVKPELLITISPED